MPNEPHSVGDVLDKLHELADQVDVGVGHMTEAFGSRSYGPFLIIPPLMTTTMTLRGWRLHARQRPCAAAR